MSDIQLGKSSKNYGVVNTAELKGGIKREQLKTEEQKSIFDTVDIDKNGVLDANEMQQFTQKLQDAAGDEKLSKSEAKKFLKNENLKDIDKEEFFKFINELSQSSENIVESKVIEQNGEKTILVTYKDGAQETINPDKTSQIMSTDENNAVTTKFFDENKKLTKEQVVQENGDSEITDIENDLPVTKTIVTNNGTKTAVISYEDGVETKQSVTEGSVESDYTYVDGKPVLIQKVEDLGNDVARVTDYTYNEDGTVTENIAEPGKNTIRQTKDGNVISEVITEGDKHTQRAFIDDGTTQELVTQGENKTATIYNTESGKRLNQVKIVDGKQYGIEYDGEGNTKGIIVQNGESISQIAKKFGVSADDLMAANQDKLKGKNTKYFDVGDEIKIPRELEADDKALQGRKSADEVKAEYARDEQIRQQRRAAARERDAAYRKLGLINYKGAGEKVIGDFWNKNKKTSSIELTKIGNATHGRTIARDKQGKIYVIAHNGVILKDSWVEISAHRETVKAGNSWVAVAGDNADGYARKDVIDANGKTHVMSNDNHILREDYLEAHKAYVNTPKSERNNTVSGQKDVTYVKDSNGKVWYFDDKTGKAIVKGGYNTIVQKESDFVTDQLYTAAKGIGTDDTLLEKSVKNIYSRDILQGVNSRLRGLDSDYAGDAQTMPVEALILDEKSHGSARPLFKTLIESGTMTTKEQANTVKRELKHEVSGGLGITRTSDVNEVMQLVTNRDVRLELESQLKKDEPELVENEGSVVRSYLAADGFSPQEVDQFDANWIKTGAYAEARYVYQTDENGNIILDKNNHPITILDEGDQAHRNGVIGRLVFDYQDKEALNKGLEAVNDAPNSFDYQYLDKRAGEEVAKDPKGKYQSRFTNQDNVQRYLAGFHTDETGKVDVGNVSASNTCLFKGEKPARIQAEETLYKAKEGDYSNTFDSMDPKIYSAMAELIANGDVKGVKDMNDLYQKAYKSRNGDLSVKANAILSGQINFSDEEISEVCITLMHSIDRNYGLGATSGRSGEHTNIADYQTEQLKTILQNNPQIMDSVKAHLDKENFSFKYTVSELEQSYTYVTDRNNYYKELIADTKCIVQDEIFCDENGKQITDPEQIQALKDANMSALENMRQYVAELERDFAMGVNAEGSLSGVVNGISRYSNFGTDRGDVANEYHNAKLLLGQLEAAAQGKLRDSNGKVISAQDLAKQVLDKQNTLTRVNGNYKQTIAYGKMGLILGPVIVATTVASGGAAAVGWGTLGTAAVGGLAAGTTTYAANAFDYNTSYTGNTAEAREQNLEDSVVNGLTTAIGIGQMKYIGNIANNMGTVTRTTSQIGATVAADTTVGAVAEYATTGDISTQGIVSNLIMSGTGNIIGAKTLNGAQNRLNKPKLPESEVPILHKASSKGNATPSSVKVGKEKAAQIQQEVKQTVSNPDISGEELAQIRQDAGGLTNREVRRDVIKKVDDAAKNLSLEERASFDAANNANAQKNVNHIFEKHSVLNDADTRVINEYINNTDDVNVLRDLQEKLTEKEYTYGGVTANYNRLRKAIDDKLASLEPSPVKSNLQQHDDVVAMLNEKAQTGKGLNENDFNQITDYLSTVIDESQLKELTGLLGGKKMTSVQKKQIKELLTAKQLEINNKPVHSASDSSSTIDDAVEESIEIPEHKKVETDSDLQTKDMVSDTADSDISVRSTSEVESMTKTPAVIEESVEIKSEKVVDTANSISEAEIPAKHRNLWKNCKERIANLSRELSDLSDTVNPRELLTRGKALLTDLKTIGSSVTGAVKNKIQNIYNDLRTMLNNVKVKFQNNSSSSGEKPFKFITSEEEALDYFQQNVEKRFVDAMDASSRAKQILNDGKPYFMDLEGIWRYEIHESTGNMTADYKNQFAQRKTSWKIHIYATNPQEWANAAQVAMPILRENKLIYKTIYSLDKNTFNMLNNNPIQKGKAFTIYFRSEDEFVKTAKILDAAFQKSGLKSSDKVLNEAQIGDSGLLSYRDELAQRGVKYKQDGVEDPYLKSLENDNNYAATKNPETNNANSSTNILSSEQKMAMGYIGNDINMARTPYDIANIQKWLDQMPECSQKTRLQRQLNEKYQELNAVSDGFEAANSFEDNKLNANENSVKLSDEIKASFSEETQAKLFALQPGETMRLVKEDMNWIVRNNNGTIEIVAQGSSNNKLNANIESPVKFSDEIKASFSEETQAQLSALQPGETMRLVKKDKNWIVRNNNGTIEIVAQGSVNNFARLDKYKYNKNRTQQNHQDFYNNRSDLFSNLSFSNSEYWATYYSQNQQHGAWKMHLYANNEQDWQNMSEAIIPYLMEHDIEWKTINSKHGINVFNGGVQEGKAFTIYPRDNAHMEQVAKELDYIIRNNNLELNGSNIVGDRAMGNSGRLFYRYEFNTGSAKNDILDLSNQEDFIRYDNLYDGNEDRIKRNKQASYLADDMTLEDDIWRNFDPSDPNSKPDV